MDAQCRRLVRILTYSYSPRDTAINTTVLALTLLVLALATSRGRLSLSSAFWLPFALFVCALQLSACVLTGDEGFSMVWCSILGLLMYEHAVHSTFVTSSGELHALALTSYSLAACAVVYYAVEEVTIARRAVADATVGAGASVWRLSRPGDSAAATCWLWCGATCLHLLCVPLGAGLVALVDMEGEREAGFWVVLAAALLLLLMLPLACHCSPPKGRVHPAPPPLSKALSDELLRLGNLRLQLERCQETLALLRGRRQARDEARGGGSAAADGAAGAAEDDGRDLDAEIDVLERREGELLRRIDESAAAACAAMAPQGGDTPPDGCTAPADHEPTTVAAATASVEGSRGRTDPSR